MAISVVALVNLALSRLGDQRIASLDDNTPEARAAKAIYEATRDAEQARHRWTFCIKRAELATLATTPVNGFGYAYQLPADCIRVHYVGSFYPGMVLADVIGRSLQAYAVEGRTIVTDLAPPLSLLYGARIEDPTWFDPPFVDALAYRLAMDMCQELTGSTSRADALERKYGTAIAEASRINAIQNPSEAIADDTWMLGRF